MNTTDPDDPDRMHLAVERNGVRCGAQVSAIRWRSRTFNPDRVTCPRCIKLGKLHS